MHTYEHVKAHMDQYGEIETDREKYDVFFREGARLWPFINPKTLVAPKRVWIILDEIAKRFRYGENDQEEMYQLINETSHVVRLLAPDLSKKTLKRFSGFLNDIMYDMM